MDKNFAKDPNNVMMLSVVRRDKFYLIIVIVRVVKYQVVKAAKL